MNTNIVMENEDERQHLLSEFETEKYIEQDFKSRIKYSFNSIFKKDFEVRNRIIKFNKKPYPHFLNNETNYIDNNKYKWYTFIFLFLYYEFREFSNFYYLILCVTQFFDVLAVGFKISYITPVAVILAFRLTEEIVQELRIKNRDKLINNKIYQRYVSDGQYENIKSSEIRVGDIIKIGDERVPADVVILSAK